MLDFITNNLEAVSGIMLALFLLFSALYLRQWDKLRIAALQLMLSAEQLISTREGAAKMEEVYAAVWAKIPKVIKRFVTEKTLREKLQEWYDLAKDSLGKAPVNKLKI